MRRIACIHLPRAIPKYRGASLLFGKQCAVGTRETAGSAAAPAARCRNLYIRPQDRIAVLLGIGSQRPAAVDDGHAERLELLLARGGERLVEDAAGLGKRERHRVSP